MGREHDVKNDNLKKMRRKLKRAYKEIEALKADRDQHFDSNHRHSDSELRRFKSNKHHDSSLDHHHSNSHRHQHSFGFDSHRFDNHHRHGDHFHFNRGAFHHHDFHHNGHFVGEECSVPFIASPFNFCINNFRLNFNGLNGNLAFQLFRFKGCEVKVVFECAGEKEEVEGTICNVGTNFVDIIKHNKTVVTILIQRICNIVWEDKHCNPCPCCDHDCGHDHGDCDCDCGHDKKERKKKKDKEYEEG
ncbi:MAG TPA: hypothetical protein VEY51_17255 [Chondromyces sp.]|nr:hypothetical protein [Chondromyces sp.]